MKEQIMRYLSAEFWTVSVHVERVTVYVGKGVVGVFYLSIFAAFVYALYWVASGGEPRPWNF
ncbi:hypothetical protein IWQ55_006594 [Labrenzia sp. EL_208]|nr:hypothetical protein [Labrenzia sp. EL_132]MBG6233352.1 hypothetical protein [Labrenzia sp. EL_208]